MNEIDKKNFRRALIAALDTQDGITEDSFVLFGEFADSVGIPCGDIDTAIKISNGFVYLPEDHGLIG